MIDRHLTLQLILREILRKVVVVVVKIRFGNLRQYQQQSPTTQANFMNPTFHWLFWTCLKHKGKFLLFCSGSLGTFSIEKKWTISHFFLGGGSGEISFSHFFSIVLIHANMQGKVYFVGGGGTTSLESKKILELKFSLLDYPNFVGGWDVRCLPCHLKQQISRIQVWTFLLF